MDENVKRLLELVKANPDLPVIPMVNCDVVADDDCARWAGSLGSARVDEYITVSRSWSSGLFFKHDEDMLEVLECCLSDEEFEALPEDKDELRKRYNALPWTKAIILNIDAWEG